MQIQGCHINIAGSAAPNINPDLLRYSHDLIKELTLELARNGAKFIVGGVKEPHREGKLDQLPIIFDWTVIDAVNEYIKSIKSLSSDNQNKLLFTAATQDISGQIPQDRQRIWQEILENQAIDIKYLESGWSSGAVRRAIMAEAGDILIILGGGEGVEHLAENYAIQGKPVIPIDLELGASKQDGTGGAKRLFRKMLAHPDLFFKLSNPDIVGAMTTNISTGNGQAPVKIVSQNIISLIHAIEPPSAFYVRLLDPTDSDYNETENYFREVVDPFVKKMGYRTVEMGLSFTTHPWMNQAIFEGLYYSALVIVDLTGLRSNCFTELGYALGLSRQVILTAKENTNLPFDCKMLECNFWSPTTPIDKKIEGLKAYWARNIRRPPLVHPREIL